MHRTRRLLATLLLALSPFHVWYSRELRGYSMVILAALAAGLPLRSRHFVDRQSVVDLAGSPWRHLFEHGSDNAWIDRQLWGKKRRSRKQK